MVGGLYRQDDVSAAIALTTRLKKEQRAVLLSIVNLHKKQTNKKKHIGKWEAGFPTAGICSGQERINSVQISSSWALSAE